MKKPINKKILITGGAGFIGSNLIDHFLKNGHKIVCLDNLATGFKHNISHHFDNTDFTFIKGDIRDLEVCRQAVSGCDYVLHEAALGSVPRSIKDPATTNDVNISGFLNMLIAARDEGVKRFVYAASSSTYGDSKKLPKVEDEIGKPLSPYAITKYVNELYADVFAKGKREYYNIDLENHKYYQQAPSEDKVQTIHKSSQRTLDMVNSEAERSRSFSEIFNVAFGGNTNLIELFNALRDNLSRFDKEIKTIEPDFGSVRPGDIPHSQASIKKAEMILNYTPEFDARTGFERVAEWYYQNLK